MKKFKIYLLSNQYIEFMRLIDDSVMQIKGENGRPRPYVGIVLLINNFLYFVPLTSRGKKWYGYDDHILLKNGGFGAIKFGRMVPIDKKYFLKLVKQINIPVMLKSNNFKISFYGNILKNQWALINKKPISDLITKKAETAYWHWELFKKVQEYKCNFKKLEVVATNWSYFYPMVYELIINYPKNTIY